MAAQGSLSHSPDPTWACPLSAGDAVASKSDLWRRVLRRENRRGDGSGNRATRFPILHRCDRSVIRRQFDPLNRIRIGPSRVRALCQHGLRGVDQTVLVQRLDRYRAWQILPPADGPPGPSWWPSSGGWPTRPSCPVLTSSQMSASSGNGPRSHGRPCSSP